MISLLTLEVSSFGLPPNEEGEEALADLVARQCLLHADHGDADQVCAQGKRSAGGSGVRACMQGCTVLGTGAPKPSSAQRITSASPPSVAAAKAARRTCNLPEGLTLVRPDFAAGACVCVARL